MHLSASKVDVNAWKYRQVKLISTSTRKMVVNILDIYELMSNFLMNLDAKIHKLIHLPVYRAYQP